MLSIDQRFLASYRRAYNRLADVDVAHDDLVRRENHDEVIADVLRLIRKADAAEYLGVTLLHRHFPCPLGAILVERRVTPGAPGHRPVLVTSPTSVSGSPRRMAPHRFALTLDNQRPAFPLEFTTDRAAIAGHSRFEGDTVLQHHIGDCLRAAGAADVLGVGIYARDPLVFKATRVFFEEQFDRSSVVHVLPRLPRVPGRHIQTLWTVALRRQQTEGQCTAYCSHPGGGKIGYCGHRKSTGPVSVANL